ncbi:hypothetical protein HMPREF1141_0659 [Clostridium sp. MSTE9]|nr:hypothetical protein HMPREF1141_0659 [Clostridium sp. MSTE9]
MQQYLLTVVFQDACDVKKFSFHCVLFLFSAGKKHPTR